MITSPMRALLPLSFILTTAFSSYAQNLLPGRNDILSHKLAGVVITKSHIVSEKISHKQYVDTVLYNPYGTLTDKKVTAYDTASKRAFEGHWTYTYDSMGNRALETRVSNDIHGMDYYNYMYDSNRIVKQIWVYWVNMKHIFDRIYEVKYDGYGRLKTEIIEEGTEKIDTVITFQFDTLNHLNNILSTRNKDLTDTINLVHYVYNADGSVAKTITTDKLKQQEEEFSYDANKRLIKQSSPNKTISYAYDATGLLKDVTVVITENKLPVKYRYNYSYLSR
jgi:YD repeat-containing protein